MKTGFQLATVVAIFAMTLPAFGQNTAGKCTKTKKAFAMTYAVSIDINATPEKVWQLLTDGPNMPTWNSTINSLEGKIAQGEKIKLVAAIAPERTFSLKVDNVIDNQQMKWKDGAKPMFRGVRTYTLTEKGNGVVTFTMTERFAGVMLPMIKGALPDFTQSFEDFARDLKAAAEG